MTLDVFLQVLIKLSICFLRSNQLGTRLRSIQYKSVTGLWGATLPMSSILNYQCRCAEAASSECTCTGRHWSTSRGVHMHSYGPHQVCWLFTVAECYGASSAVKAFISFLNILGCFLLQWHWDGDSCYSCKKECPRCASDLTYNFSSALVLEQGAD